MAGRHLLQEMSKGKRNLKPLSSTDHQTSLCLCFLACKWGGDKRFVGRIRHLRLLATCLAHSKLNFKHVRKAKAKPKGKIPKIINL